MVLRVEAATFILLVVPSSRVTRIVLRFGKNLLLVLLLAWLTLLPTIGPLPVIAHLFDIFFPYKQKFLLILSKQNQSIA